MQWTVDGHCQMEALVRTSPRASLEYFCLTATESCNPPPPPDSGPLSDLSQCSKPAHCCSAGPERSFAKVRVTAMTATECCNLPPPDSGPLTDLSHSKPAHCCSAGPKRSLRSPSPVLPGWSKAFFSRKWLRLRTTTRQLLQQAGEVYWRWTCLCHIDL